MLAIFLLLLSCFSATYCMVEQIPVNESQMSNLTAYNAYLELILKNLFIEKSALLQQLAERNIICSETDIELFEQQSRTLRNVVNTQVTQSAEILAQIFAKQTIELHQMLENLCLQGMTAQEIYQKIKDVVPNEDAINLEFIQHIAEQTEEKKKLLLGDLSNQICIAQIHQLIMQSKYSTKLAEKYRVIAQQTGDPLQQLKALELYAAELAIQESARVRPYSLSDTYVGSFPEALQKICDQYENPEKYSSVLARTKQSILFMGEPGTGKTFTARALASRLNAGLCEINCSQLLDKYVGEAERKLEELINEAERYAKRFGRCVIFFDEFDTIARKRGEPGMEHIHTTLNRLLSIVEQKNSNLNLIFIAATNSQLKDIDPALTRPGRFGIHVYFKLPSLFERTNHLRVLLEEFASHATEQTTIDVQLLARLTDGFSPSDLKKIIAETLKTACHAERVVTMNDFLKEIDTIQKAKHEQRKKRD